MQTIRQASSEPRLRSSVAQLKDPFPGATGSQSNRGGAQLPLWHGPLGRTATAVACRLFIGYTPRQRLTMNHRRYFAKLFEDRSAR